MHFITINKTDSVIVDYRVDDSVPEYWTVDTLRVSVASDRGLAADDLETIATPTQPEGETGAFNGPITPSVHCFDTMTGLVRNNPAYVPPPVVRYWRVTDVRPSLTLSERVKWDNDKTDSIKTAKIELATPRVEADAREVLQFLVDSGDISTASMQRILA